MNNLFSVADSLLLDIFDNKWGGFLLLFLASYLFYFKCKARSGFSVANRILVLCMGSRKKNRSFFDDVMEIERFNFLYNTNALSISQIEKFESWIKKYELDFRVIPKLRKCFDIEKLKIKKFKSLTCVTLSVFSALLFLAVLGLSVVAIKPSALIKITNEDSNIGWFWLNRHEAMEYNFWAHQENAWVITPKTCEIMEKPFREFNEKAYDMICESFKNKSSEKYISTVVKQQRWGFGFFSIFFLLITIAVLRDVLSLLMAVDARMMLLRKIKKWRKQRDYKNKKEVK
jgi:hypothetical protein